MQAEQSLSSDHFYLLSVRGVSDRALLSASEITIWDTRLEKLGWLVNTQTLAVTAPPHKRLKLRLLLAEWPPTRTYASAKQVSQLAGFLTRIFSAVRLGSFFMPRLGCRESQPVITSLAEWPVRGGGPEFHADLEFWQWFVDKGVDARMRVLSAPMYHLLKPPAQRALFSDA